MNRRDLATPLVVLAWGAAALAGLWGLAMVLRALAYAVAILVKAIGAAVGLGVATATTGFATAGVVGPWLPTAATGAVVVAAVGTIYMVFERIVEKAKDQPFEWLLPLFAILAALMVDLTKDTLLPTNTERALYTAATAGLVLGGGILLRQRKVIVRALGVVLPFCPCALIWMLLASNRQRRVTIEELLEGGTLASWGLVASLVLAVIVVLLGLLLPLRDLPDESDVVAPVTA